MKIIRLIFFIIIFILSESIIICQQNSPNSENRLLKTSEIRVRDPFILAEEETQTYYLYSSIHNRTQNESEGQGVEVYISKDLENWTTPQIVFKVPKNFWATKLVWAPEVHLYKGKYYLFTTFTSNDTLDNPPDALQPENWPTYNKRGCQILVSDSPVGPFNQFSNKPHIAMDLMTLDGTLWIEDNKPYMIYCHEWVEIKDGTIDLIALKDDLSATEGENQILFKASSAPWVKAIKNGFGYVTDGCFLYKTKNDKLIMIWSSIGADGYSIGTVISESDSIKGPWKHLPNRLFKKDGGHGMIFKTFDGQLIISLHQPNLSPNERIQLYKLKDLGDRLELDEKMF